MGDAGQTAPKICRICGKDISQVRRVKDTQGRYRCPTCVDAETPGGRGGEPGNGNGSHNPAPEAAGGLSNPALAETKVDMEAVREPPASSGPRVPAFPERHGPNRHVARPREYDEAPTPPPRAGDDEALHLAPERDGGPEEYHGAVGPRKRIQWSSAEDDRRDAQEEAEAQAELAAQSAPEIAVPVDPNHIPEDRSGLYMRLRPGQLKLPAMLTVVGILGAAGLAFGLRASPNETNSAINAAVNSGISAAVQAAMAVGIYALCCAIWIRPRLHWQLASVRLAAFSSLMAAAAIALAMVPQAGPVLLWALPLLLTVGVLRKLLLLHWLDAIYCGLLIYSVHLGVRVALDADLWVKSAGAGS